MIYFISNGTYTKIGKADEPKKRLKELQTGCPEKLEIKLVIDGGEDKERMLHKALNKYRFRGEWFQIDFNYNEQLIEDILYFHRKLNGEKRVRKVYVKNKETQDKISDCILRNNKKQITMSLLSKETGVSFNTLKKYIDIKSIVNKNEIDRQEKINKLQNVINDMKLNNERVNKNSVSEKSGVSRTTVTKHWNKLNK
jgi:response regulator of citrate/malate metabolism